MVTATLNQKAFSKSQILIKRRNKNNKGYVVCILSLPLVSQRNLVRQKWSSFPHKWSKWGVGWASSEANWKIYHAQF